MASSMLGSIKAASIKDWSIPAVFLKVSGETVFRPQGSAKAYNFYNFMETVLVIIQCNIS